MKNFIILILSCSALGLFFYADETKTSLEMEIVGLKLERNEAYNENKELERKNEDLEKEAWLLREQSCDDEAINNLKNAIEDQKELTGKCSDDLKKCLYTNNCPKQKPCKPCEVCVKCADCSPIEESRNLIYSELKNCETRLNIDFK